MREDFMESMISSGLEEIVANRILDRFQKCQNKWDEIIDASFINAEQKKQFQLLISNRLNTLLRKSI